MAATPPAWKRRVGTAAYFVQAIKLAVSIGVQPYRITIDERLVETEASVAMVGNMGHLVPGLLRTRLPLDCHDGLLDLLVVGARNPIHGLRGLADQVWRTSLGGGAGASSLRLRGHADRHRARAPGAARGGRGLRRPREPGDTRHCPRPSRCWYHANSRRSH